MARPSCKIKYRRLKKKRQYQAYVAHFANGRIKQKNDDKISFTSYRCQTPSLTNNKILVGKTNRLTYVGTNFGEVNQHYCKYYIGALNKRTGKMKVYDAELFDLKPVIQPSTIATNEEQDKTRGEKLQELTSMFGSKVKKRALAAMKQFKVEDSNIQASISSAVSESVTDFPEVQEVDMDEGGHIPPQNPNASMPDEVYNLKDIIPDIECVELDALCEQLQKASMADIQSWKENETYPNFVTDYLTRHLRQVSSRAKLLVYYSYMWQMHKLNYKDLQKKDLLLEIPKLVREALFDRFTLFTSMGQGKKTRKMPNRMKDKLITHSLIVALFLESFQVKLEVIQKDFKLTNSKITRVARAIGCHVLNRKELGLPIQVAQLKLPLFVPREFAKKKN